MGIQCLSCAAYQCLSTATGSGLGREFAFGMEALAAGNDADVGVPPLDAGVDVPGRI